MHENKIVELQYKILMRILGRNDFLHKIGIKNSDKCERCRLYVETIEHVFWGCFEVRNLWFSLVRLWNQYSGMAININEKYVLLGIGPFEDGMIAIDLLILYVKQYIYSCKIGEHDINIAIFFYKTTYVKSTKLC